jgi:hypothetical protein
MADCSPESRVAAGEVGRVRGRERLHRHEQVIGPIGDFPCLVLELGIFQCDYSRSEPPGILGQRRRWSGQLLAEIGFPRPAG